MVRKEHSTCQFVQHFREQLLAGGVKNEEFLESEKHVPAKCARGKATGHKALPSLPAHCGFDFVEKCTHLCASVFSYLLYVPPGTRESMRRSHSP